MWLTLIAPPHTHIAALDHRKEKGNPESSKLEPETIRAVHMLGQSRIRKDPAQDSIASSSDVRGYHGNESVLDTWKPMTSQSEL